jgi:hypothetical protein
MATVLRFRHPAEVVHQPTPVPSPEASAAFWLAEQHKAEAEAGELRARLAAAEQRAASCAQMARRLTEGVA